MKVLLQRSKVSSVEVNKKIIGQIKTGLVVFVGFTIEDTEKELDYIINKIVNLRIFNDENGVMNNSLLNINGEILSISQFTLYGDTKKGRRPSYDKAMNPKDAIILYDLFNKKLKEQNIKVETGEFGADTEVSITNDGPVTMIIES